MKRMAMMSTERAGTERVGLSGMAAQESAPRDLLTRVMCILVGSTLIGMAAYVLAGADIKPLALQAIIAAGVAVICVRLAWAPGWAENRSAQ